MTVILFLLMSLSVFAQQFQYRLDGSFQTSAAPGSSSGTTVNYNINWNETSTAIQGTYQDNYFTQGKTQSFAGMRSDSGRRFLVILPTPTTTVRTISLVTPEVLDISGSLAMSITTQDEVGAVIDNQNNYSLMTVLPTSALTNNSATCVVGFGSLTKLCGIYSGNFNELTDSAARCDLQAPRFELGTDTVSKIYVNFIPGIPNPPAHVLGSFPYSPTTPAISLTKRDCTVLPGTTFEPGNCRTMNLNGTFLETAAQVSFTGTYVITDDQTGDSCSYSMTLSREQVY